MRARAHHHLHRSRGFSLAELLVATAIVSVLAGIGVPTFQHLSTQSRLTGTANELLVALATARAEAVSLRVPTTLALDSDAATGAVSAWSLGERDWLAARDVRVYSARSEVGFATDGTATPAEFIICFRDRPHHRLVRVSLIGRAEVDPRGEGPCPVGGSDV
ncbi:prepilin-type N-terminal cleavage/methylation domain-containing protein [Natronocella acetinitrilica]|uniref:Type II secretion system protein H n=1 Tax=Natronocella acetinitrilica TaxID=414046 RepID=A0AAE3G2I8_9GAMM|nr:GspH/FimT family pseudopilin [Natronocella acetinitrilica]MCP1674565.1 prepilin-type N-terminal cleavage/methylation domain-containing protein [Natronocella acetinitrilica]